MARLDDPRMFVLDSLGLMDTIASSEALFAAARGLTPRPELPFPASAVANVAICAVGGSAIAGDLVVGAFASRLRKPVVALRDYYLPGWVGEDTLVVLVSYSGETEETLTAAADAIDRGCLTAAITSGGKLGTFYPDNGVPTVTIPGGLMPRAALLSILVPLVEILARCDVIPPVEAELDDAMRAVANGVASYGVAVPQATNVAKSIAMGIDASLPVIWGAESTAAAARRWKCQLNENSKMPAYWGIVPEVNHNEIVGFDGPDDFRSQTTIVMLRDPHQHRQVERRFALTRELIEGRVRGVISLEAEGETPLGRTIDLVMLGDYVSLYAAILRSVDPGPIAMIDRLKDRLANTGYGRQAG
ncbi:MAG: bifunctional phosphoglucose/phosphomannose isomerase [Actinobacteria bacterium]|nr:bifunctional phosphoglucose/phosphomannose isomerase [Actinomycetota bacterium]